MSVVFIDTNKPTRDILKTLDKYRSVVYFAQMGERVKIGMSRCMPIRYGLLKSSAVKYSGDKMGKLAVIPTDQPLQLEREYHRRFAKDKSFKPELFDIPFETMMEILKTEEMPKVRKSVNIVISRTLPDDALSAFRVKDMRPDESIIISCDTVAEFNKSRQTAKVVKSQFERPDGYQYKIQSNSSENTIKVSLFKEEKKEESEVTV